MKYVLQPVRDSNDSHNIREVEFILNFEGNPAREVVVMKLGDGRTIVFRMEHWAQLSLATARGVRFLVPQEETLPSKG